MTPAKDDDGSNEEWKKKVQKRGRASGNRYVVPNSQRGGWDVVRENHKRVSAHEPTQQAAEARAREIVAKSGGEVIVRGLDGSIRRSDSAQVTGSAKRNDRR
jgi:hypothetical protein